MKGAQARLPSAALLAVFFASGFSSLVYQIAGSRMFYPVFGMNLPAITAVVAAFMGGLGVGAHLIGRWVDRADPWKTYAMLEVGIGCFGLLLPHVASPLGELLAGWTPPGSPGLAVNLVRFVGVTLLLAGPCLLMGGTFPAFVRGYSRTPGRLGRDIGSLYAINTVGAASGSLVTGVWLLPSLGLTEICYGAATLNFLLALAIRLAGPTQERPSGSVVTSNGAGGGAAWAPLVLLFLTGYLGLSFELLWTRALTQPLGATYLSFSIILTAMLLGIFLGSALYRALLADRERPGLLMGLTVLLLLASVSSFLIVSRLQPLQEALRGVVPVAVVRALLLCLVAFLPTATVLGAIFPLCLRTLARSRAGLGRELGLGYGVNTAGAVIGVVSTGLVTIELLGSGGTLILLFVLATVAVCVAFFASTPRLPLSRLVAVVLPAVALAALFPSDVFFANQLAALRAQLPGDSEVLFQGEDATSMATLVEMRGQPFSYVEDAQVRDGRQRDIFHSNWRGVGGTRIYLWNVMGGYLAGMLHPDPEEVLVIGYGSGRQLKTLASLPHVGRMDTLEVNPLNFAASDYFYLDSSAVLRDPRVHVFVDDGRNHLLRSRQRYDVIVVDVGGIDGDGSEFFYTREFLELCRDRLRPGGLLFTWMDIRQVLQPVGLMYRRTLHEVFPDASVWLGTGESTSYGWLWLVGSEGPLQVDLGVLKRRWSALTPHQRAELDLAGLRDPEQLASLYLTKLGPPPAGITPARVLTDDRPYCKPVWRSSYPTGDPSWNPGVLADSVHQLLETESGPPLAGASEEEREAVRKHRASFLRMAHKGTTTGRFRLPAALLAAPPP
ncbi:MAG: fused MFS/spermidine synthase [Deltaproteobacteria bacterium]|nr:fused MFS/spermidine synthase [Deltaproteobacteria bacterium]